MATTTMLPCASQLSDAALLAAVPRLAARERDATVTLIAHLAELDARRLYLAEGSVTLTTVTLLAAHLTPENHRELLDQARHKSRREVEALVARLLPQPP